VRGGPGSREFRAVIEEAQRLVERGCPELVLTGITIGRYESGGKDLASLLEALSLLEGDFRVRVTSIEPNHMGERLVEMLGSGRVCPHIHLPLQSGSDRILRRMRRPYTADEYMRVVDIIRKKDDKIAIGTDIIIGFPGEDETDFRESLAMVDRAGFSYVHQFSFSPRTGTPASSMPGACRAGEAVKRSARMRERGAAAGAAYRELFRGQELPCVIERNRGRAGHAALSGNYIRMDLPENPRNALMEGRIAGVRLVRTGREGSFGEIL
jgi:threonylcarbamoyladenosine tRNA methylthiotransferase MtaB